MLKYVNVYIGFSEIPDEISLLINISNCPCNCEGCHSAYLAGDIGEILDWDALEKMILQNTGITCICFMGGDNSPYEVDILAEMVKYKYPNIKTAWYSGREEISKDIHLYNFDYIKIGPYIKEKGPLNSPTTNQKLYKIVRMTSGKYKMIDITNKFWKNEIKD